MDADDIATSNVTNSINTYILANKFTIYVNNKYAHNRIYHQVRDNSHAQKAANFLKDKYQRSSITFNEIDWHNHLSCLSKLPSEKEELH